MTRSRAEPGDLLVVADLEVERMLGAAVRARLEQDGVALRPELVRDLLRRDRVELRLDVRLRHARVEDLHVGPEVRRACARERGHGQDREERRRDDERAGEAQVHFVPRFRRRDRLAGRRRI
jgi:hypothetical protein